MSNALTTDQPLGQIFELVTPTGTLSALVAAGGGGGGATDTTVNNSAVPGANATLALNALGPAEAKSGVGLPDADTTIATTTEKALLANVLSAPRTLTITPSAVPGKTFAVDKGTQTQAYTIAGGGPQLGTQVIAAGGPQRLLVMSDGFNIVFPITIIDLAQEPTL